MTDKALIPLAYCNAHQITKDGIKGDWQIRENETGQELGRFPGRISDADMFAILHFARQYELAALNAGIEYQKKVGNAMLLDRIGQLEEDLAARIAHDEFLADQIERLTAGGSHGDRRTD